MSNTSISNGRSRWASSTGFILAATGSAVGLGAIWKFPYTVQHHGGGVFLLVFFALTLLVGLSLLRVEMALGRSADASVFWAFRRLGGRSWGWVGALAVLTSTTILSYYSVVGGWTLAYFWQIISAPLLTTAKAWHLHFATFAGSPAAAYGFHGLFLLVTLLCVANGVQKGIETLSKILMPCLFVMMCLLIVRGLMLPGAIEGVIQFVQPDWSSFTTQALLEALGLSFWTLSLAMGVMVTYGSYLPEQSSLAGASRMVALLTLASCVLAGLLVLPPAIALGIDEGAGPGLTFVTMPLVFAQIGGGPWFGAVFFALLFVAALTSSMSILEVPVAFLIETLRWSRRRAAITVALVCYAVGILASLSIGDRPALFIGGRTVFEWLDYIASHLFLPIGGILTAVFAAWWLWPKLNTQWQGRSGSAADRLRRVIIGIVVPVAIVIILWHGLTLA